MSRHEAARSPWPRPATALRETLAEGYTAADFRRDLRTMARAGWTDRRGRVAVYGSFERAVEEVRKAFE